jgi:hypothetical protein
VKPFAEKRPVNPDLLAPLLASARLELSAVDAAIIQSAFADEQNAAALLARLEWHGLVPLAARHVSSGVFDVPDSLRNALRTRRHAIAGINLFMARELERVMDALAAEFVEALPFKGPSLAVAAFGDVSLRQFSDLDILVDEPRVPPAIAVLEAAGYELKPGFRLNAAETRLYLRQGYHLPFRHRDHATELELHWQIAPGAYQVCVDFEQLWSGRMEMPVGSHALPALSAEDHFLLLTINAAKEMWDRVSRVADCAGLLARSAEFDWDSVAERARTIGAERMLWLGAYLATTQMAAPVPSTIARRCGQDPAVVRLAAKLPRVWREQICCDDARVANHAFFYRCLEVSSQRFWYFFLLVFRPSLNDVRAFRLPGAGYFLAWLLRPFRLVAKWLSRSRKSAKSSKAASLLGTYANSCTADQVAPVDVAARPSKVTVRHP